MGSPQDLVDRVSIELSRTSGIPYPRLMELSYLVRHPEDPLRRTSPGHPSHTTISPAQGQARATRSRSGLQHQG